MLLPLDQENPYQVPVPWMDPTLTLCDRILLVLGFSDFEKSSLKKDHNSSAYLYNA